MPTAGDDAVIDVAGGPTISITTAASVHSLTSTEAISIDGGSLTVAATADVQNSVTLAGGFLIGGVWSVAGRIGVWHPSGGTLDGVVLDSDVTDYDGPMTVKDGLVLNGTLTADFLGSLVFSGTQTLSGTGQVLLTYGSSTSVNGTQDQPAVLTVAAGMTIHGQGCIDGICGSVLNQGTIRADDAGPMSSNLDIDLPLTNAGTLGASGSGALNIGANVLNQDAVVEMDGGGAVYLSGALDNTNSTLSLTGTGGTFNLDGGSIEGGTITGTSDAGVLVSYRGGTLDGVVLDADLTVPSCSTLTVEDGLVLNGTLTVGAFSSLVFSGTQTLSGPGQVLLTKYSLMSVGGTQDQPAVLTVAAGMTIHGAGNIREGYGVVVNEGAVRGDDGSGHPLEIDAPLTNAGTLEASGTGALNINANVVNQNAVVGLDGGGVFESLWSNRGREDHRDE